MSSRFQTSTGAIMLLVIVVALELVMFQDVWEIVLAPPVTMVFLALNLGLVYLLIRPLSWHTRILGMIWGGLAASLGFSGYDALTEAGGPGGRSSVVALFLEGAFKGWGTSLKDQQGPAAITVRLLSTHAIWLEALLLYALGIGVILFGGRVQGALRTRWMLRRAPEAPESPGS
jgi:hypothetical protein